MQSEQTCIDSQETFGGSHQNLRCGFTDFPQQPLLIGNISSQQTLSQGLLKMVTILIKRKASLLTGYHSTTGHGHFMYAI